MAALDWGCSSSSSAFTTGSSSYDVFLNFRGKDTRNNFTGFLYKALKDGGINVFIDSQNLWTGEAVGPALGRAIEGSKISIPIFSKGYAHSKWCLRELSHIVQCHRSKGQLILPIFFHVDPSHVRNQTGRFKAAFQEHKKNFTHDIVKGWKDDLEVVGNLKGEVLDETKDQAELVELVVKRVLGELVNTTHLALCKYPIGINSPLNNVLSLLDIGSNDVQFVGICGFGGIGKTTIVKAVYNDIFLNFNRHSFLSDVKEQATQGMGLVSLQKQLLKDIFRMDIDIANYHRGKKLIEERLCKEKVLLVLDDVDNQEQIDALAGELNWFGQGSRIIITTRDEHILNVAKISKDKTYWPQVLDHKESLQLFSLHAFSMDQPPDDYIQLSYDVACYSGGLPLTLEVLGSYLADITDKELWESTLEKLKKIPHERVQRRLKISYDNLEDHYQKAIFLDAACFFIGWDKETLISIWEACGYFPKSAIIRLIKRSLLKFEDNEYGCCCLRMHDQIRDMGREIVKEENLMEPGKRSRLWSHGEILEVIKGYKGTDMIKGMILRSSMLSDYLSGEHFVNMSNLRFLGIDSAKFNGDFSRLPSELRSFIWECKTCDVLPTNFFHKRLVYLNLSSSEIKQAWNIEPQNENKFQELKVLDLNDCRNLYMSPNFSWFPCLERLDLGHCYSLDKLDESIGQLSQLKSLVLESCNKLKNLPESIGDLKSLVKLDLSWTQMEELPDNISKLISLKDLNLKSCNSLKKLPESIGDLKYLVELQLSNVSRIKQLPESIGDLKSLVKLDLSQTQMEELPNSICRLSSLKELILKDCISPNELPKSIGDLKSLVKLELSGTQMEELPDSICRLSSLKELILRTSLKKLPKSIGDLKSLVKLDLSCTQIIELPDSISRLSSLKELILEFCKSLKKLPESIGDLKLLCELKLTGVSGIKELPKGVGLLEKLEVLDCGELVKLPVSMGRMRCLHSVNLQRTNITKLPDDFSMLWSLMELKISGGRLPSFPADLSHLKNLKQLKLRECKMLEYLPELPSSLVELCCEYCNSLVRLPNLSRMKILKILKLKYCKKLEEIQGLEGTESLVEFNARRCYNLTITPKKIHGQGTLLLDRSQGDGYFLTANGISNEGLILSLVLKSSSHLFMNKQRWRGTINLDISVSIRQKDKTIRCLHTVRVKDVEFISHRDMIYIHHFKGFDWFGIPLEGKDAIEILYIRGYHPNDVVVKFWKILFKTRDPDQKNPNQHSSAMMVADFFNWSSIDDDEAAGPSLSPSLTLCSRVEFDRSNYKEEKGGEMLRPSKRTFLHDNNDNSAVPSLSLSLKSWSQVEVPNEKEEKEGDMLRRRKRPHLFGNDDEAAGASSSMSLTCWSQTEVEGSNSVPNEKEEKEGEMLGCSKRAPLHGNNDEAAGSSSSLSLTHWSQAEVEGSNSVPNEKEEKEGEMLRCSKRAPLHDNNDEAAGSSSSMSLTHWSQTEVKGSNSVPNEKEEKEGEMLRHSKRAPHHGNDDEAAVSSSSLSLMRWLQMDVEGSNSFPNVKEEKEGEMLRRSKRAHLHDNYDEAAGSSNSLVLTHWSEAEVEGSNSVHNYPNEKEGKEREMLRHRKRAPLHGNNDEAAGSSSSLSLTHWFQVEVEGSNSFPNQKEEKEREMLRPNKRVPLHDNNDEHCEVKLNNKSNLQQILSQQLNIDDDVHGFPSDTEEVERNNRMKIFTRTSSFVGVRGSNNVSEEIGDRSDEMIDSHSVLQMKCLHPLIKKAMLRAGKTARHDEDEAGPSRVEEAQLKRRH